MRVILGQIMQTVRTVSVIRFLAPAPIPRKLSAVQPPDSLSTQPHSRCLLSEPLGRVRLVCSMVRGSKMWTRAYSNIFRLRNDIWLSYGESFSTPSTTLISLIPTRVIRPPHSDLLERSSQP